MMAKHRTISQHSLKARTVIGGVVASGALLVVAPASMALAKSPPSRPHEEQIKSNIVTALVDTKVGTAIETTFAERDGGTPRYAAVQGAIEYWVTH